LQPPFSGQRFPIGTSSWVTDFGFSYRLPERLGRVSVAAGNLFNNGLAGYQDSDPANPRFSRGRLVFTKITLEFY
jgi:hypothetical protein